jgi:hypothetical protein
MDALDRFGIAFVVAAAETGYDAELLFPRHVAGQLERFYAVRVDPVWFFDENMPAGFDGGFGM